MKGFIGTYNDNGIYSFDLDNETGTILNVEKFGQIKNSKYLKVTNKYIYSIITEDDKAGVVVLDNDGLIVSKLLFETIASCYIEIIENKYVYTSNYHEGTVTKLIFENNELTFCKKYLVEEKAGCHQIINDEGVLYIPCLNMDKILIMDLSLDLKDTIILPSKVGPRHGVISNRKLYIITENSNQLYKIDMKTNEIIEVLDLTVNNEAKSSAIRLSNCEKYILIAVREENNIYKVRLDEDKIKIESIIPTLGDETRDMISILDKYILAANQHSGEVISISIEDKKEISRVKVPECAVIVIGEENEK